MRWADATIAAWMGFALAAPDAAALPCTPCKRYPPGPRPMVVSNDFKEVNVIGGVKVVIWGFDEIAQMIVRAVISIAG